MTKWELATYYTHIGDGPADIWTKNKDKETGKSDWDNLQALASDGWELVSLTPIKPYFTPDAYTGGNVMIYSQYLLYTFKRPLT